MVRKVISGGQSGADQGGLKAAKLLGLATGGWMPKGYRTLDGPRPDLADEFGLREHASWKYPPRTQANVRDSDATVRFARDFESAGERCTLQSIRQLHKPVLDIDIDKPAPVETVCRWLASFQVVVLNVAGNTEREAPGIEQFVAEYLVKVLKPTR